MANDRITESTSNHDNLENLPIRDLIVGINQEDQTVPNAIAKEMDAIENLISKASEQLKSGGRLFYMGAGTSGRLGIVDASECPPTFGVDHDLVIGIIAGGDSAIRKAVEFAEDDTQQGWRDLKEYNINSKDFIIGIAASGKTPYVIGALKTCQEKNIPTGCISCNPNSPLSQVADYPIEVVVGPEFVTGSTRMKSGTAQKLVLNMISTACMIRLGRVKGNRMVDMQLSNDKLVDRGTKMVMKELNNSYEEAESLLKIHGSVRKAVEAGSN
ncbi:MAG: N-acetylmuramic acid 6-phosphate etherase [Salibacteraceae bacterium]